MNDHAIGLRRVIQDWLQERFHSKTEKLDPEDEKYQTLAKQFRLDHWLFDAARRVSQLQVVTHSLKPIHPDAKGSGIYFPPSGQTRNTLVGTPSLGNDFAVDVVGNAAALDVFKFLKLEYNGQTLLERVEARDDALLAALNDDPAAAAQLLEQFAGITTPSGQYASHTRAKQIYWLIDDDPAVNDHFHLLAPLYATSLAHRVYHTINDHRFSEATKAARQARRANNAYEHGYCDYPNLAVQRFGGSKPQNISQLNSERRGDSYLLCSAPPTWHTSEVSPIRAASAFAAFGRRRGVGAVVRRLGSFLATDPTRNMNTRDYRDECTLELVDELIVFTSEMHQLPAGWTDDWHCRLAFEHQCWLDPRRADQDTEFAERLIQTEWLDTVCADFSRWLIGRLERYWRLAMGDTEHRRFIREVAKDHTVQQVLEKEYAQWRATLAIELSAVKEVLNHDE